MQRLSYPPMPFLSALLLILTTAWVVGYDASRSFQENFIRYQAKQRQQLTYSDELKAQAEQGDAVAQFDLAMCYAHGKGVTQNKAEAVRWWTQAARQKVAAAAAYLGDSYRQGDGARKDPYVAYVWYSVAVINGSTSALASRDAIASELSADQIVAGKAKAIDLTK
jgi:TPR repeat protein